MTDTARIRQLNDMLRTTFIGGLVCTTPGFKSLPDDAQQKAVEAVQTFTDFNENNDPHSEHDCAIVDIGSQKIMFKIDYYDLDLKYHSEDAADPTKTRRVMVLMLVEEY